MDCFVADGNPVRLAAMPAAPLLSEDEIRMALDELPGWQLRDNRLIGEFRRADFADALRLVNRVAEVAEQQDHHPDVVIHWRDVSFSLWTHVSGGVTRRDLRLARAIHELARAE